MDVSGKLSHTYRLPILVLLFAVTIFGTAFLLPQIPNNANAEGASTDVGITVNMAEELSLSADASSINIVGRSGEFKTSSTAIHARTNVLYGYTLTMTTTGTDNTLKHTDGNLNYNIPSIIGDNIAESSFPSTGGWGYSLDTSDLRYHAIPSPSSTATLDAPDTKASKNYTFTIGTKLGDNAASGSYTNRLLLSLTANPKPVTWDSMTDMQQITSTICDSAPANASKQLIDTRDGKEYTVAKLADGNCWMVDNLRFAGTDSTGAKLVLDSTNSDLNSGVTFDLIGSTPSSTAYTTSTSWLAKYDASEYYPDESQSGGQYYGYYYNWYAAIAGTVSGQVQQDGTGSICPKGWTLPHNYTVSNPAPSYSDLFYKYGIIANITDNSAYAPGKTVSDLTGAPLRFIRAGNHNAPGTSVRDRGSVGGYWPSTSYSGATARLLVFDSSYVFPQFDSHKYYGYSVRCVAR